MKKLAQSNTNINRRFALGALAASPILATTAHAAEKSAIPALYKQWDVLTKEYKAIEANWLRDEITNIECEDQTFPIFTKRNAVEEKIWATKSSSLSDLALKIKIAEYYEHNVIPANAALVVDANNILTGV